MVKSFAIAAFVSAALCLSACATPAAGDKQPAAKPETATQTTQPETQQPEPASTQPETTPEPTPDNTKPVLAGDLIGLDPAAIQALFGSVSLKRWEGEAQVMQFENETCVLDIYFYEKAPGEAFEATFVEARDLKGDTIENDACVATFSSPQ